MNAACLIHRNALIPQFILGLIDLRQQALVGFWTIVEPQQPQSERSKRV
jgi:hypothetical protein